MSDPLTVLRGYLSEGKTPIVEGDDIIMGRYRFNKNALTAYKSQSGFYTIGTVHFLHANRSLNHGAYILAASRSNIPAVAFNDKKELLQYLDTGELSSSIVFDSFSTEAGDQSNQNDQSSTQIPLQQDQYQQQQQQQQSIQPQQYQQQPQQQYQQQQKQQYQQQQQQKDQRDIYGDLFKDSSSIELENVNFDQFKDYQIQDFSESEKRSEVKINPLLTTDKELSQTAKDEKIQFAERIDLKRVKPDIVETSDTFIESIKLKRNKTQTSEFIRSDEDVAKAINQREKKSSDKVSILQSSTSFISILNNFKKFKSEEEEAQKRRQRPTPNGKPTNGISSPTSFIPTNLKNRTPIIIVPSTITSPISIYNSLDFLQNSSYKPTMEKRQEMTAMNISKPSVVNFDRITTQKISYEVIDNIRLLKPEDWYRVAAVFVQGEAWQFKDWKWSNPPELFSNVRGFYVKFDDSNVPDVVKSWDVKVLHINKTKRHLDHTAQVEFWNAFDDFVNSRKSYLNH